MTTNQVDPSQNPISPYYLHPSDNPGMKLVPLKFDGTCYANWKRSMIISLSAKNKLGFVDGTIVKPIITDDTYKAWERCNNMLISWLLGVLDQHIIRTVLCFTTASEIWTNLEERYGQSSSSGTQLFELQLALQEVKQGSDNISGFYTKIKMIWDQLDSIDPIQICSCTNCTCGITGKLLKSQQDRRLIEFLMKLNAGFEILRGSLLVMSPLPTISHAYSLLLQEENHKKLYKQSSSTTTEDTMAFAASRRWFPDNSYHKFQPSTTATGNQESKPRFDTNFCDHCKTPGHSIQRCYKLHGYPSHFKDKRVAAAVHHNESTESHSEHTSDNISLTSAQYQQLNYTHFVSLPLAIYPQLVNKILNFQNSILGISNKNEVKCLDDDNSEDTSDEESREIQSGSTPVVTVNLNAEEGNRNPKVGIRNIPPVSYPSKASKPSKLDEKTTALSALGIDKSIFIEPKTFHLTVLMLKLYNKDLVDAAANVLQSLPTKIMHALDGQPVAVRLKGLECMRGSFAKARVLYAPVEVIGGEDRLLRACQVITDAFTEAGLVLEKDAHQKLKLHATLMNTSHRKRTKMTRRADTFDARGIVEQFGSEEWGEYLIREAHLSRRFVYDENGYYQCRASIPFPEKCK